MRDAKKIELRRNGKCCYASSDATKDAIRNTMKNAIGGVMKSVANLSET